MGWASSGAVGAALSVALSVAPVVQLGHAIAARGRCLVVLDNFEQVVECAEETVGAWLDRSEEAHFVVTSRQRLQLRGEAVLVVEPLSEEEAVALFVDRAARAGAAVDLGRERVEVVALVGLLDGLPLAIELAAARLRLMSPAAMLQRMGQRFRLLSSGGGRPDRHATLRATLSWSWELLSAEEQAALAQCSVFEGSFTLEAAEEVLSLGEALWVPDVLAALVDHSLLRVVGAERFSLLISVQQYAAARLSDAARAAVEERHGRYYARFGTIEALEVLGEHDGVPHRRALVADLDNWIVAVRRAVSRGDGEVASAALEAAWAVLSLRGPFAIGSELAAEALSVPGLSAKARLAVVVAAGRIALTCGQPDRARVHIEEALGEARRQGDRRAEGQILGILGILRRQEGRPDDAKAQYEAALRIAREVGHRRAEGVLLANLGVLHHGQGRFDDARTQYEAVLQIARSMGHRRTEASVLGHLGLLSEQQGRFDDAKARCEAALQIAREVGDRRTEGIAIGCLGVVSARQGKPEEARDHHEAALQIARSMGDRRMEETTLGRLSALSRAQGQYDGAKAYLQAAIEIARSLGRDRVEDVLLIKLGLLHLEQRDLDQAAACLERAQRSLHAQRDPSALGRALCLRARLLHAQGDRHGARTVLDEAVLAARGTSPTSALARDLADAREQVLGGETGDERS